MQLQVLGSGSILSGAHRNPAGYIVEERGKRILMDAGPGILRRIDEQGYHVLDFDGIILSHFHLDHCSDVMPLLMKRQLSYPGSNRTFFIAGSAGLPRWFEQMAGLQGDWLHSAPPEIIDISLKMFSWNGMRISCFYNGHTEDSIAVRLDGNRSLFFSSDTDFSEELAVFAGKAHLGIAECSHSEKNKMKGHMVPSETGHFAALADFEHLVVTHLYPENEDPTLSDQIARGFNGKITIASDGLRIEI